MKAWKMYLITIVEIVIFLIIGFFLSEKVLNGIYESMDIPYIGNLGIIWFGVSFLLFSLYTVFQNFILAKKSPVLKGRISSITFWFVFLLSVYAIISAFVRGEI